MKIKKKLKIIIPLIIIAIGAVLIIIGLSKGAVKDYNNKLELNEFEANVAAASIANLDIDVSIADVNIICTNDVTDFYIEAENITKDLIEYTTSNNTLKLIYNTKKWYETIFIPGYKKADGTINIYVPADISLKDVEITAKYGELNVSYLTADRVFIDCAEGDNHIKNLTCNYAEINNKGANLNGVNINAIEADLNLNSDAAVFSNFTTESLILKNDGDLKLSGMITGDSALQSDGGDAELTLYGYKSDYSFKIIDGDVTVNGKEPDTNDEARYYIEAMGDMIIHIK